MLSRTSGDGHRPHQRDGVCDQRVRPLVQATEDQAEPETIDITAVLADEIAEPERGEIPVSVRRRYRSAFVEAGIPIRHVLTNPSGAPPSTQTTPRRISRCQSSVTRPLLSPRPIPAPGSRDRAGGVGRPRAQRRLRPQT